MNTEHASNASLMHDLISAPTEVSFIVTLVANYCDELQKAGIITAGQRGEIAQYMRREIARPKDTKLETTIESLGLETRTYNVLENLKIVTVNDLMKVTEKKVMQQKWMGKISIARMKEKLLEAGFTWPK